MNTSIQHPEPNGIVQPSVDSPRREGTLSAWRKLPGRFTFAALLAGLLLLLFSAPAARAQLPGQPPGCQGSGLGIALYTMPADSHVGCPICYSIKVFNGSPGGLVVCDASNITAFVVTPDGTKHSILLATLTPVAWEGVGPHPTGRTYLHSGEWDYYTNVVCYPIRLTDINTNGNVTATAQDIGIILQNDTPSASTNEQGVNTEVSLPCVKIAVQCTPNVGESGPIYFTGTVTNCGNTTLTNLTVTDFVNGGNFPVAFINNIPTNSAVSFSGSWVPVNPCSSSTVTFTVQGGDIFTNCPQTVISSASTTCTNGLTPGITVTKRCPERVVPGQPLIFTFSGSVSNSGNITLTNIVVVNNQPSNNTPVFTLPSLAPGASTNFTGSYMVPITFGPVPICSVTDTLTATGRSVCGVPVTNTVTATCPIFTSPRIVVTTSCPTNPVGQGGLLTYSGTVSNAGNITLTNIVVVNNWPPGFSNIVVFTVPSLAPGATTNFTGTYVVPLNCCVAWIWVEASGQGCDGVTVTDTDSRTCAVFTSPGIVVTKVCVPTLNRRGQTVPATNGGTITYTGTVCNTGNITLYNVTVVDNLGNQPINNTLVIGPIILAPGECKPYTGSYIVPPDFCGADTVTARGFDYCSGALVTNSATATCPIAPYSPRIVVTKQCPPQPTQHGGQLIYSGTVSNAGNVTLINVFVVDNQPSNNTPVIGPIILAPGAVFPFTGRYTTPLVCCTTIDTLTARGQDRCSGSNVSDTATAICPMLYTPGIALVQICPPNPLPMGSVYNFSGIVTNTGDAILTNVVVFGSQAGTNLTLLGPIDLAPGQSEQYTGSLTVPSNICAVTITVTGQETCAGTWITNTTSCPVATTPVITVTESCPSGPVTNGSSVTFGGSVCNSGNITLTNIFVFSSSTSTPVLGPIWLAPGACLPFTGSYLATGGCNLLTNITEEGHGTVIITWTDTSGFVTNTVFSFSTNIVVSFTPTNTVTAIGQDICQSRTVTASANCGCVTSPLRGLVIGTPTINANGFFSLSFPTEAGKWYTVQYKNTLTDPIWTDLVPPGSVSGTGGIMPIMDSTPAALHPTRFYRIMSMP